MICWAASQRSHSFPNPSIPKPSTRRLSNHRTAIHWRQSRGATTRASGGGASGCAAQGKTVQDDTGGRWMRQSLSGRLLGSREPGRVCCGLDGLKTSRVVIAPSSLGSVWCMARERAKEAGPRQVPAPGGAAEYRGGRGAAVFERSASEKSAVRKWSRAGLHLAGFPRYNCRNHARDTTKSAITFHRVL